MLGLSLDKKIAVLIELAKVLSQFHSLGIPIAHGSINSHNVFVEFPQDNSLQPIVRLGELEMSDFKRYANMFYSYRSVTVWSPPECLKQQKKRLDPNSQMDVYSFGMIMWEVLHEKIPFDGELKTAIEYVVEEDARPLIQTMEMDQTQNLTQTVDTHHGGHNSVYHDASDALMLTSDLANIIRRCWQTDPSERMKLS